MGRRMRFRYLDDPHNSRPCWFHEDSGMFIHPEFVILTRQEVESELWKAEVGSKLELVNPFKPRNIVVGTIIEVLNDLHLIIGIDGTKRRVRFHASEPTLLSAGFATQNNLSSRFRPPDVNFK